MKIKTFKFIVSNMAYLGEIRRTNGEDLELDDWNRNIITYVPVASEKLIDDTINKFIKNIEVIDIKVNDIVIHRHNNGRGDTIERTYTILYKQQ